MGTTRAHVEIRDLDASEIIAFRDAISREFAQMSGVLWTELNPYTRRVVVAFQPASLTQAEIERHIDNAERAACCSCAPLSQTPQPHPANEEVIARLTVELAADVVALCVGGALGVLPLKPSRVGGIAASALSIVKSAERLRGALDQAWGTEKTEFVLNLALAGGNLAAQRAVTSATDALHKLALLREATAQYEVWARREPDLTHKPMPAWTTIGDDPRRPRPLPKGPVEQYADRAWLVSLTGFLFSFLTSRSVTRASAALFGGLPKPARLGREVFSAELSRILAQRNVLVLDSRALRRLDRTDCLVLAEDVVTESRYVLHELRCIAGYTETEARTHFEAIFDADRATEAQHQGEWQLRPAGLERSKEDGLAPRATELAQAGHLVLELLHLGKRVAICAVELEPYMGLEELVTAARKAEMRVLVASSESDVLERLSADERIGTNVPLAEAIARLQNEGYVVCTLAAHQPEALRVSDFGIGLKLDNGPAPWGAHVICGNNLADAEFLITSATAARQVSRQSVNIALIAASMGAMISTGGVFALSSRRVMNIVNVAAVIAMLNGLRHAKTLARHPAAIARDRTPWHVLDAAGVMHRLGTSEIGLTQAQVAQRQESKQKPKRKSLQLLDSITDELFNPLAPLLAAGAGLSAVAGSTADALMVGAVVVLNACVGGIQKYRTELRIRDLSTFVRRQATVHRDGKVSQVDAADLVPGDIIVLTSGDMVPADCRILHAESVEVDSSSLTGESLPVRRSADPCFQSALADRTSMLYAGTTIAAGRATAIVIAAGQQTETASGGNIVGRLAPPSGVEQRLLSLINLTAPVALGAGVGLVGAGLLRGRRMEHLVPAGVSLAVASVPEGLPLLATAAQLAAARRLSTRGALVRNPRCIEALGRVDVLCIDKTGTLTEGRLDLIGVTRGIQLMKADQFGEFERSLLLTATRAAPDPRFAETQNDPTDAALFRAAEAHGIDAKLDQATWERDGESPYEPTRGYHAVLGHTETTNFIAVKGAPEVVIRMCGRWRTAGGDIDLDGAARDGLRNQVNELARTGLRLLAVAAQPVEAAAGVDLQALSGLTLLGLAAFSDPIRPSARQALARLRQAGVEPVLITGDHPETATTVAQELGLVGSRRVVSGTELQLLDDDELDSTVQKVGVFARVTPAQKARVVRSLQRVGRVVAMVGDGANDAPAIRLAHVGVAIGELSTGAARSAADVVLTDERIGTLVEAITEGRAMWASVRDAVSILVGGNLGEIGFTLGAGLIDGRPPLSPRQLLLVNLLTDVAPAMAIALRPPPKDHYERLAKEGPDASLGRPLNRDIATRAFITAFGAGSAWMLARFTGTAERAHTVGLLALVGTQLGQTVASGGFTRPVVITSLASTAVLAGIVQTPGLSQFFGCQPLGPLGWATAIGATTVATGVALTFPQVTSAVAARLGSIDRVLTQPVTPSIVPPPATYNSEPAPLSAINAIKGLFSEPKLDAE